MFYIWVIKCQGTEDNNGPQWPYPASPDVSFHHCPMAQDPISAQSGAASLFPSDTVGVRLSSSTKPCWARPSPHANTLIPVPDGVWGCPPLPSWLALLPGWGLWNRSWQIRPVGIPWVSRYLAPGSCQSSQYPDIMPAWSHYSHESLCSSIFHRGKVLKAIFQRTHLQQCFQPELSSFHAITEQNQ